jgi:flagellar export protein FliJ
MHAFRFRLQRVLEWQRTQCGLAENRLKQLYGELGRAEAAVEQLRAQRTAADIEVLSAKNISLVELAALAAYRAHTRKTELVLVQKRTECETRLSAQRQVCTEEQRQRKLLEKLYERRRSAFDREVDREMEGLAGELFLARWATKDSHS